MASAASSPLDSSISSNSEASAGCFGTHAINEDPALGAGQLLRLGEKTPQLGDPVFQA